MFTLDTCYVTLDIWHRHWYVYTWHLLTDNWYLTPVLDMLLPDTWYLIPTLICYTWHLIPDTWYLTPVLDMLSLNTWYLIIDMLSLDTWHMISPGTDTFDLILSHLTGYYYTWHLFYFAYSWLSLLRGLSMIIILLPDIWYSWTPVLLNSCIPEPL